MCNREPLQHPRGMAAAAIGEDKSPARQTQQRRGQCVIDRKRRQIDVMDKIEIEIRIDAMFAHQPVQRRAVLAVVGLLQPARLFEPEGETLLHKGRHPRFDLVEQGTRGGIERIVEIEQPRVYVPEIRTGEGAALFVLLHCG